MAVTACIAGGWAWMGAPVAMPPSPLAAGEKLHCISYAPFRDHQSPLVATTHIDAAQIDEDLARLKPVTDCVRTYSVDFGLDQVPAIAARHGMKVLLGLWLSSDPAKNRYQIDTAIALANRHPDAVSAVVVGNEVLLRGEMAAPVLADTIRQVKAAVKVPVTYADVWEFWLRYREIAATVDFVTIHILPYWEDFPVPAAEAGAHVDAIRGRVAGVFAGKEILIGEVGWPSAGRMREGALPSPSDQARVLHDVLARAKAGHYRVNVIEAFDQSWKRALEGTVGGHWGLFAQAATAPKFGWGTPVSNHPRWPLQAALGAILAAAVFAAAWRAGRARATRLAPSTWLAVAGVALAAGAPAGAALEWMPTESLGLGGWIRSLALLAVAVAAPLAVGAALAADTALPAFSRLLGGAEGGASRLHRLAAILLLAVNVLAVQVALGLVFDPRYRDFPLAPLAASVLSFAILSVAGRVEAEGEHTAERIFAAVLGASALYIALNEGFANGQALGLSVILLVAAATLMRVAGGQSRR